MLRMPEHLCNSRSFALFRSGLHGCQKLPSEQKNPVRLAVVTLNRPSQPLCRTVTGFGRPLRNTEGKLKLEGLLHRIAGSERHRCSHLPKELPVAIWNPLEDRGTVLTGRLASRPWTPGPQD